MQAETWSVTVIVDYIMKSIQSAWKFIANYHLSIDGLWFYVTISFALFHFILNVLIINAFFHTIEQFT